MRPRGGGGAGGRRGRGSATGSSPRPMGRASCAPKPIHYLRINRRIHRVVAGSPPALRNSVQRDLAELLSSSLSPPVALNVRGHHGGGHCRALSRLERFDTAREAARCTCNQASAGTPGRRDVGHFRIQGSGSKVLLSRTWYEASEVIWTWSAGSHGAPLSREPPWLAGSVFRVCGSGLRVEDLGLRVEGAGLRVKG